MSKYRTPAGIFSLKDSDNHVGSFIRRSDLEALFQPEFSVYADEILSSLSYEDDDTANEECVACQWSEVVPSKLVNQRSFDEIILDYIIRLAYPTSVVDRQVPFGPKPPRGKQPQVDFTIEVADVKKAIEFWGPGHFVGRYAEKPSVRQEKVKRDLGIDCVVWPFWIQRCKRNVKALFEPSTQGLGALWSCSKSCLFGKFPLHNSAEIVEELNRQFRAARDESCGYFYERNSEGRMKPEHYIFDQIRSGTCKTNVLIPSGVQPGDYWKWLPKEFVS